MSHHYVDNRYAGNRKRYLGDGCYVNFDGYQFTLTTEDGIRTTNTIVLEPEVYVALMNYVKECVGKSRP